MMKTSYRVEGAHAYFTLSDLSPLYQNAASNLEFTQETERVEKIRDFMRK